MVTQRLVDIALNMPLADADLDLHRDPRLIAKMLRQIREFPCWALPSPDDPMVLCGIVHDMGVGEVWMLTGQAFLQNWRTVYRQHRQLAASFYEAMNLHRMHMMVDPTRPEACRYAVGVGFLPGNIEPRFGHDGRDRQFFIWPHNERKIHG